MTALADFRAVGEAFATLVSGIRSEQWNATGLGDWSVRSLVGHTLRAITTVENYLLADEPGTVTTADAEHYFLASLTENTDHEAIAARGTVAGDALSSFPAAEIRDALGRTVALCNAQPPSRLVAAFGHAMPLDEYLRTRVFELVVHSLDIARSTGQDAGIPDAPLTSAVTLAAAIAVGRGLGPTLLLGITGRGELPPTFSVL